MAFFSKASNILRQISRKHINQEVAASKSSIFQLIRCMSSSKVFVGGLSYNTNDTGLSEAFSNYGEIVEARVIQDRETGRSRGFGFVTFTSEEAASAAIQALDNQELHGRRIKVNYANDRARGGGGGGYGGGYGGGGYGGGGYGGGGYGGGGYGGGGYGGGSGYGGGGQGGNYSGGGGGNPYGGQGGMGGYNAGEGGYVGGDNYATSGSYPSSGSYAPNAGDSYNSSNSSFGTNPSGGDNFGQQFGSNNSNAGAVNDLGLNPQEPVDGEFRDDDDVSGGYADRRA